MQGNVKKTKMKARGKEENAVVVYEKKGLTALKILEQ